MSREDVEVVREAMEAINRRDSDALTAHLHPDVVWEERSEIPGMRGVYRGWPEVRVWLDELLDVWESFHVEPVEITELTEDRVFVAAVIIMRGEGSGVETEFRVWAILWLRGGKITRREVFWDRDEALEAAGLKE
jgi:ketosteroid isomerase-like protein